MMHLTVVMSVFNGEPHLGEAVESMINQSHRDFTFITTNNGSTDRTGEILKAYAAKHSRMQVIHNTTTVTYVEGRQQGIERAETDWVALIDADDVSERQRLERQLSYVAEFGERLGAVGSWAHYINGHSTSESASLSRCGDSGR